MTKILPGGAIEMTMDEFVSRSKPPEEKSPEENKRDAMAILTNGVKAIEDDKTTVTDVVRTLWDYVYRRNISSEDMLNALMAVAEAKGQKRDLIRACIDCLEYVREKGEMLRYGFDYVGPDMSVEFIETQGAVTKHIDLCGPLRIRGTTQDARTGDFGVLVSIQDRNGAWRDVTIEQAALIGDGEKWLQPLLASGLRLTGMRLRADALRRLLHQVGNSRRVMTYDQCGWLPGHVFAFPDGVIGDTKGTSFYWRGDDEGKRVFATKGTLDDWKEKVAKPCSGNSRFMFTISAALAAPLLEPLDIESGGFHLVGGSSCGKTTALRCAASVFGEPSYINTWRGTSNGAEGLAYRHNHTLLAIDEIGQARDREIGSTIYMIANEREAARKNKQSELRAIRSWKTLFLSTGEMTIAEKVEAAGGKSTGGQAVRAVDIAADAGKGLGAFDRVPPGVKAATFSNTLKAATAANYGTAGRAFIEYVANNYDAVVAAAHRDIDDLAAAFAPEKADGQVFRVAMRFALVAFAGELAIEAGVLPWQKGSVVRNVQRCFNDWLGKRGTVGALEPHKGVESVLAFIEKHGQSRFQDTNVVAESPLVIERAGFKVKAPDEVIMPVFNTQKRDWEVVKQERNSCLAHQKRHIPERVIEAVHYYFTTEAWVRACGSYSPRETAIALKKRGLLVTKPNREKRLTIKKSFPGLGKEAHYYVVAMQTSGPSVADLEKEIESWPPPPSADDDFDLEDLEEIVD